MAVPLVAGMQKAATGLHAPAGAPGQSPSPVHDWASLLPPSQAR